MSIKTKLTSLYNVLISKIGDKTLQALCSFVITFLFGLLGILLGVLLGCMCAIAKEAYSEYQYKVNTEGTGWNWDNIKYSVIGIVIALVLLLII